mgnify:CR=1 FL=1
MTIGVNLTNEDLQAVKRLYKTRWGGDIKNWKERDTDYCLWVVSCPDKNNGIITETGQILAEVIEKLLERAFKGYTVPHETEE